MKLLSKIMATTAVATLMAGGAMAQSANVGADIGADVDVSVGEVGVGTGANASVNSGVSGTAGATTESNVTGTATATTDSNVTSTAAATTESGINAGTVTGVAPGTSDVLTIANATLERGETVDVLSADGRVLGQIDAASQDQRGAAELSINLDSSLGADVRRVTFVGLANVDGEGRVVLPLAEAEFLSRIQAQTAGSAG